MAGAQKPSHCNWSGHGTIRYHLLLSLQIPRQSTAFDGGTLAPEMGQPAHCFNKIAASAIIKALDIQNPRLSP